MLQQSTRINQGWPMMAHTEDIRNAFFYGTLVSISMTYYGKRSLSQMSPEVLYRVIYGTILPDQWQKDRLNIQPGLLYGYQRHRVKDADYPAIYPLDKPTQDQNLESQRVLGTIVRGLLEMDIRRLDIFEGDTYIRQKIDAYPLEDITDATHHVQSPQKVIQAETYVWKEEYLSQLDFEEWDFEEFRREKLKYWAGPEIMREDYDRTYIWLKKTRADLKQL